MKIYIKYNHEFKNFQLLSSSSQSLHDSNSNNNTNINSTTIPPLSMIPNYLLQIRIIYELSSSNDHHHHHHHHHPDAASTNAKGMITTTGYCFRYRPHLSDLFEATLDHTSRSTTTTESRDATTNENHFDDHHRTTNHHFYHSNQQQQQQHKKKKHTHAANKITNNNNHHHHHDHSSPISNTNIVQCLYTTTSNHNHTLRNIDGIRCWLPCLDALDQRLVFDITIIIPINYKIACSGKRISTYIIKDIYILQQIFSNKILSLLQSSKQDISLFPYKLSRFYTSNITPAMSIGFFIGIIEQYRMNLYKVKARIWVAMGLNDFMLSKYLDNYHHHYHHDQHGKFLYKLYYKLFELI